MLDSLLKRVDVVEFINEIKTNEKYNMKTNLLNHDFYMSNELALFVFYDALYKYRVLFNHDDLFSEYLEDIKRLYKKLDAFEDIRQGINKLLCKLLLKYLNIKDINLYDAKKELIEYLFDKYINNGYYIHGFSSAYIDDLKERDYIPEQYENYYDEFKKVKEIFDKYKMNTILSKNFSDNKTYFTDDFLMGCYYSIYAPMFFYQLILNNEYLNKRIRAKAYLESDFAITNSQLNRLMKGMLFTDKDRDFINQVVQKEERLLQRNNKKIALLLCKRDKLSINSHISVDNYLNNNENIYEIVDKILSAKQNVIVCDKKISKDDYELVVLEDYYKIKENKKAEKEEEPIILDEYGKVSILIILGSLLISFGVIISIVLLMR